MNNQFGLLVKVFLLSALISTLIKYLAPSLTISAGDAVPGAINIGLNDVTLTAGMANAIALVMVLSPTVIVAALLTARIALFKRT